VRSALGAGGEGRQRLREVAAVHLERRPMVLNDLRLTEPARAVRDASRARSAHSHRASIPTATRRRPTPHVSPVRQVGELILIHRRTGPHRRLPLTRRLRSWLAVIRALLFDFDGVILDTEVPTYESWRQIYGEYGVDLALSDWLPVVGSGTSTQPGAVFDAVAHLETLIGTSLDRDAIVERRSRRKLELCDRADLLPGVVAYLADARRLLLKTAIVTRGSEEWVQHHLARVCLGHSWDVIVCADGAHTRPKSEFYLEALTRLEVARSEAIAFEDSPHGVRAAREAGLACVAIPNKVTRGGSFEEADVVLASLADRPLTDLIASVEPR
jgi:HAD superfamily hydrolase (TIGR01509 family)